MWMNFLAGEVTRVLGAVRDGDENAVDALLPLVYSELRSIADAYLRRERPGHTLEPTALVHEAYARLVGSENLDWKDRAHFIAIAARSMRQILVNHALAKNAEKRGGGQHRLSLDEALAVFEDRSIDLLALDEALKKLSDLDPEQARVVELRFFGGLTVPEAAEALGVSVRTVERDWTMARAWLRRELVPD
jgi:RNA polymerase sigma-70 factor, ECF subfamily